MLIGTQRISNAARSEELEPPAFRTEGHDPAAGLIAAVLLLAGCGDDDDAETEVPDVETETETEIPGVDAPEVEAD